MLFPEHVEFEITNHCNINCIMCPHSIMNRSKGFMSWKTLKKGVDECKGRVKTTYLHQIGEPLLHPDLIKFINYTHNAGIRTSISTNAVLLDRVMAERILGSQLDEITLCLDSLDKETYEKIRKGADYNKVYENIQYFVGRRKKFGTNLWIQIQLIKIHRNKNEWDRFTEHFNLRGIGEILVKEYSSFAGKINVGEQRENLRKHCPKIDKCLTIQWNGDAVVCCRDFNGISKLGNINEKTIQQIFNSPEYQRFKDTFPDNPLCRKC